MFLIWISRIENISTAALCSSPSAIYFHETYTFGSFHSFVTSVCHFTKYQIPHQIIIHLSAMSIAWAWTWTQSIFITINFINFNISSGKKIKIISVSFFNCPAGQFVHDFIPSHTTIQLFVFVFCFPFEWFLFVRFVILTPSPVRRTYLTLARVWWHDIWLLTFVNSNSRRRKNNTVVVVVMAF